MIILVDREKNFWLNSILLYDYKTNKRTKKFFFYKLEVGIFFM